MPNTPSSAFRQRLVQTSPKAIPEEVIAAVRQVCSADDEVQAAYVCSVAIERDGHPQEHRLQLGIKLTRPIADPGDLGDSPARLLRDLGRREPRLLKHLQVAVLADRAEAAWAQRGVRIFPPS